MNADPATVWEQFLAAVAQGPAAVNNTITEPGTDPTAPPTGINGPGATVSGRLPWEGGPNMGQTDAYGNTYKPVNNAAWGGGANPLSGHVGIGPNGFDYTAKHDQLWGGATADSPPQWLRDIVHQALDMPAGPARDARIRHIMASMTDPSVPAWDVKYVNQLLGFSPM